MDQKKIGEFITKLRKEKELTQEELADKLGVSSKSVSRWETGVNMPDYSVLNSICEEFNINVLELLNGEKKKEDNKVFEEYMKFKDKVNKRKRLLYLIISILVVFASIMSVYFINSYKKVNVYELTGENENFSYKNGILLTSNIKNILQTGNLQIMNSDIKMEDIMSCVFAYKRDNEFFLVTSYKDSTLIIEDYGYNEVFDDYTLEHVLKDLYLIVFYRNKDESKHDIIRIDEEKIMNNNKLFNKKGIYIGDKKVPEKVNLSLYDKTKDYKKFLIDNGFGKIDRSWSSIVPIADDTILSKKITKNIQIDFSYLDGSSYYYYDDGKISIKAFYYFRNDNSEPSWDNYITFKVTEGNNDPLSVVYNTKKDSISDPHRILKRYPYVEKLVKEYYENYKKYRMEVN